jgi:hypothetical protein
MTTTLKTDAQKIAAVAKRNGWDYYPDYSGRCMFGAKCPGIVCPPSEIKRAKAAVRRAGITGGPSQDSLGLDAIVYWSFIPADPEAIAARRDDE